MKKTIDINDFRNEFRDYNRMDNFSYEGLEVLFNYLEEMETEGLEIELDVIALCCDFAEYSIKNLINDYGYLLDYNDYDSNGYSENEINPEYIKDFLEEIEQHTTLLKIDDENFIVQSF